MTTPDKLSLAEILTQCSEKVKRLRIIVGKTHDYCEGVNECYGIFHEALSNKDSDV